MESPPSQDQIDELVRQYQRVANVPYIKSAFLRDDLVNVLFGQRDIKRNITRTFIKSWTKADQHHHQHHQQDHSSWICSQSFPIELGSDVTLLSVSPSGRRSCFVRNALLADNKKEQFIEVWSNQALTHCIATEGMHGPIYSDEWFASISWSKDESRFVYVAEITPKKIQPLWQTTSSSSPATENGKAADESVPQKDSIWEWKEDFGESYVGKGFAGAFLCDLEDPQQSIRCIVDAADKNVVVAQAQFAPDEKSIIFVGHDLKTFPRRLGIRFCAHRPSGLYHSPILPLSSGGDAKNSSVPSAADPVLISGDEWNVRYPRFNTQGTKIVYLATGKVGFHGSCFRLMLLDWETKKRQTVIDVVRDASADASNPDPFPGLFVSNPIVPMCWLSDGVHVVLETVWRSTQAIIVVNTITGALHRLPQPTGCKGSLNMLCVDHDRILASHSTPCSPHSLFICDVSHLLEPSSGQHVAVTWIHIHSIYDSLEASTKSLFDSLDWFLLKTPTVSVKHLMESSAEINGDPTRASALPREDSIECIVIKPKECKTKLPLICNPHGGPHSVYHTDHTIDAFFLASLGHVIVKINFRGSIGFGQDFLEVLPRTGLGLLDVLDCQCAVEHVLSRFDFADRSRVAYNGGSHGGFLGVHLIARYPEVYKACILRNPVTSVHDMPALTDIPDWCFVESNLDFFSARLLLDDESTRKMWQISPMRHVRNIKTPVLVLLGEDDKRVPTTNGKQLYHALRELGVPTRLLLFPGNNHNITTPGCEADAWLQAALWFRKYL